jgi:hypothetical protein
MENDPPGHEKGLQTPSQSSAKARYALCLGPARATARAALLSLRDRPAQTRLGLWASTLTRIAQDICAWRARTMAGGNA